VAVLDEVHVGLVHLVGLEQAQHEVERLLGEGSGRSTPTWRMTRSTWRSIGSRGWAGTREMVAHYRIKK
jgi:hypothetical protein